MRSSSCLCACVLATIIVVSGIGYGSCQAAEQTGDMTIADMARKIQALEERIAKLEERLQVLEKDAADQAIAPKEKPVIEIVSPQNSTEVAMEVVVEGVVRVNDLQGRSPVVLVRPLMANLLWVQPLPLMLEKTEDGYRFRCRVYCGTAEAGIGEKYELYAVLPKKDALQEGDQLDAVPDGVLVSTSVLVTRTKK